MIFNYTGNVQTFRPSDHGLVNDDKITLEVWGAQGGGNKGGLGGYGKLADYIITNSNQMLYIYVGGQGERTPNGGWNGGGTGDNTVSDSNLWGYSGGGGTDIRTSQNNNYDDRIIVAGGGGGMSASGNRPGGFGAGSTNAGIIRGGDGEGNYSGQGGGSSGGWCTLLNAHVCSGGEKGKGGNGAKRTLAFNCSGGGGGYYGGAASGDSGSIDNAAGAGGGSAYCSGNCSGQSGIREGNGVARISW